MVNPRPGLGDIRLEEEQSKLFGYISTLMSRRYILNIPKGQIVFWHHPTGRQWDPIARSVVVKHPWRN